MAPLFVVIASPIFLSARGGGVRIASVLSAFIGIVLLSEPWRAAGEDGIVGILLALGAALFYAAVTVTNKKMSDISAADRTVVQLVIAAAVVTPYTLLAEEIAPASFDVRSVGLLLLLGILHTGVAYLCYFGSIKELPVVTVSLFGYLDPIVAVLLSAVVLGEKMTLLGAVGTVIVLLSALASELLPSLLERRKH